MPRTVIEISPYGWAHVHDMRAFRQMVSADADTSVIKTAPERRAIKKYWSWNSEMQQSRKWKPLASMDPDLDSVLHATGNEDILTSHNTLLGKILDMDHNALCN
ncbi:hypothetical protein MBLNU13_g09390t1 [Cladosporium sp. NU13]